MKKLLVVVDMVNGFINEGALSDKNINKITPCIETLIERARASDLKIVAFKDCHAMEDEEFNLFPPHCIMGTSESDLIPELKKYEKDMMLINKNTTNGFKTDEFLSIINTQYYDQVFVCGCCTDICVQAFVVSYIDYIKKNNSSTQIVVVEDACYTFDGSDHNAEKLHIDSIKMMSDLGAKIVVTNDVIEGNML